MKKHEFIGPSFVRFSDGTEAHFNDVQTAVMAAASVDLYDALNRLYNVAGNFKEDSLAAALEQALDALNKAEKNHA